MAISWAKQIAQDIAKSIGSDRGSKIGIECPDGSFIDGGAVWTGGLVSAIEKAGI